MIIFGSMPTPKFFISLLYFFLILCSLWKLLLKSFRIIQRWIRNFLFLFWLFLCFSANPINTLTILIWWRSFIFSIAIFRHFLLLFTLTWSRFNQTILFQSISAFILHILAQFIKQISFNRMIAILFLNIFSHLLNQTWLIVIPVRLRVCFWNEFTRGRWYVV